LTHYGKDGKNKKSRTEYERYTVIATSSLYGIDILEDNVIECRKRLANGITQNYTGIFGPDNRDDFSRTITYILEKNIIWGDALTLQTVGTPPVPIIFSEWAFLDGTMVKRRDFSFAALLQTADANSLPLFSDAGEDVCIPQPLSPEYPLTHYLRLSDVG
jgi:hypothetical protein